MCKTDPIPQSLPRRAGKGSTSLSHFGSTLTSMFREGTDLSVSDGQGEGSKA